MEHHVLLSVEHPLQVSAEHLLQASAENLLQASAENLLQASAENLLQASVVHLLLHTMEYYWEQDSTEELEHWVDNEMHDHFLEAGCYILVVTWILFHSCHLSGKVDLPNQTALAAHGLALQMAAAAHVAVAVVVLAHGLAAVGRVLAHHAGFAAHETVVQRTAECLLLCQDRQLGCGKLQDPVSAYSHL
jgi:hypothetical protein